MFVPFPLVTTPSSDELTLPSPLSSQNRKPARVGSTPSGYIRMFRASGRGVSARMGDQRLSNPSILSAETAKHRGTPLVRLFARNSDDTVVPSSDQLVPHRLASRS